MNIYIGSDHNGYYLAKDICAYFSNIVNLNGEYDKDDDYPDIALKVTKEVLKTGGIGILICGSGIGMSIIANKVKGIRAGRCVSKNDAYLTRKDNNSNVICLPSSLSIAKTISIIKEFINTEFEHSSRHERRVKKVMDYENGAYNEL